jgi:signal transduction histidine kinase
MPRRSGQPAKLRGRKTQKRRTAQPARGGRARAAAPNNKAARLSAQLYEVLEQQAATAEVLRLIAASPSDLEPVFAAILAHAVRLCGADNGIINRWDGEVLHLVATHNMPEAYADERERMPYRLNQSSASGRMLAANAIVHIADLTVDRAYRERNAPTVAAVELAGIRTALAVPMLNGKELVGSFTVGRCEVHPFSDNEIELVRFFAAQAVVAVENARLLSALRQRTAELGGLVADLQRERDNRLTRLEVMAASIAHEVKQPLTAIAVSGGAALRFLGRPTPDLEEVRAAVTRMIGDARRASQVFDNIRALFGRTERRHEPLDVKKLALGALRALGGELKDRNVTTQAELASDLPPVLGHGGQLQEVFINLIHNAVEAMEAIAEPDRVLKVRAERRGGDAIVVSVEDSGAGIDEETLPNIFDPFFTTKPHGMGLGLAICRMIIERHDGELSAAPAQPRGAVFRVVLPTQAAAP